MQHKSSTRDKKERLASSKPARSHFVPLRGSTVQSSVDVTDHAGAGFERLAALAPFGGARLVLMGHEVNVGLHLAHEFIRVPAHVVEVDLGRDQRAGRVDDERAAQSETGLGVEHTKDAAHGTRRVRRHRVAHFFQQLLGVAPREVGELRIRGNGDHLGPELFELGGLFREVGEFRGAHEGEVSRIEDQDGPLALGLEVGEGNLAKAAVQGFVSFHLEVGHLRADANGVDFRRHNFSSNVQVCSPVTAVSRFSKAAKRMPKSRIVKFPTAKTA